MPTMVSPSPTRTSEEEADSCEQQEERKQGAQATKSESPWAIVVPCISIVWIWRGYTFTSWRLEGDRRSLSNARLKSEESDGCDRANQY